MKTPTAHPPARVALIVSLLGLLAAPALAQTPDAPAAPAEAAPEAPSAPPVAAPSAPAPAAAPAADPAPAAPAAAPAAAPVSPLDGEGSAVDEIGRRVRRMADELRSPFCPGKTLMTCTSYQAFELRREIRDMIEQGMSDDAIMDTLVLRHGEEVRNPPQPWYTILVPVLPFIVLGVLLFWIFRKWKERDRVAPDQTPTALDPEDAERLARLRARAGTEFE